MTLLVIAGAIAGFVIYSIITHIISYRFLKNRILKSQKWDLNICCGLTDGGGINADIVLQKDIPNFCLVEDIYNLPFRTGQFDTVLCSHTIEHVDHPQQFFRELKRVGHEVAIVIPPLYDITAAFNVFEHKYIFWSLEKKHYRLPKHSRLPLAAYIHHHLGQINQPSSSIPLALELFLCLFSAKLRKRLKSKASKT